MSIKTNLLVPTSAELFKVFIINYLKERWLLWLFFLGLVGWNIYNISNGNRDYWPLMVIIGIVLLIFISYVRQFYANRAILIPQEYELKEDNLLIYKKKGSNEILPINNIKKIVSTKTHFLLFISKSKFYYLPHRIFKNQNDIETFSKVLKKQLVI